MGMSIRERAIARTKAERPSEPVEMPEWGTGTVVYVHAMNAAERETFMWGQVERTKQDKGKGAAEFRCRLVAMTLHEPDGSRVYGDDEWTLVGQLPPKDMEKLAAVATRLNGLDAAEEKTVEGNSETAQS